MDSGNDQGITVTEEKGINLKFRKSRNNLYYFDTKKVQFEGLSDQGNLCMISTVRRNKQYFTKKEVGLADAALALQEKLGWPSTQSLLKYLRDGHVINCPVTHDNLHRVPLIYGDPVPILKGKSKRSKPTKFRLLNRV